MFTSDAVAEYAVISNMRVHFRSTLGDEPILLLHQGASSSRETVTLTPHLQNYRCICPDLPGHGQSQPLKGSISISAYARVMVGLMDKLGIENFTVFGHHFGGVVAVDIACQIPDRVKLLVLSNTPYVDASARSLRDSEAPRSHIPNARDGSHLQSLWQARIGLLDGDVALVNRYIAENLLMGEAVEDAHRAVGAYRMEERFQCYRGPVAYMYGARDPYITPEVERAVANFQPEFYQRLDKGTLALIDQFPEELAAFISRSRKVIRQ